VPEENFWTLWCKGRLTEANTPTIRLGATPSGLTSAHLHHPPQFFTGRLAFLLTNQQCQSTEGNSGVSSWIKNGEDSRSSSPVLQDFFSALKLLTLICGALEEHLLTYMTCKNLLPLSKGSPLGASQTGSSPEKKNR